MVSMDDIVTESGVSKGGVYHHFPSKQSLIEEIVNEIANISGLSIHFFLDNVESMQTFIPQIKQFLKQNETIMFQLIGGKHNMNRYMMLLFDGMRCSAKIHSMIKKIHTDLWKHAEKLFLKAKANGEIAAHVDCKALALLCITSYPGICLLMSYGVDTTPSMQTEETFLQFWDIVTKKPNKQGA